MTIKPTELAVIVLLAEPEPTSVGFPVFNVVQSTLSDVTALLASFGVVIEPSVMIALVGVTRISAIVKLEAALELFGTVTLASTIYGLPAPIDD